MAKRKINAAAKDTRIIAIALPVTITAAEGDSKEPATFDVTAYNGGALEVGGWDKPVVIDLAGLTYSRNVVANLDHNSRQRVGHVTEKSKTDGELKLAGTFSAATPFRAEVVESAKEGFAWEASVEVTPTKLIEVESGKTVKVNGQEFTGPLYVARKGVLSGFAFVSHGADPNTEVSIAATAASQQEKKMKPEVKAWFTRMMPSVDVDALSAEEISNLEADFEGREGTRKKITAVKPGDSLELKKLEAERRQRIKELADEWCDEALRLGRYDGIDTIQAKRDEAFADSSVSVKDFERELKIATLMNTPPAVNVTKHRGITDRVLEAAICQHGRLPNIEDHFDDQTLQFAHDRFKSRIDLSDVYIVAAEANGFNGRIGKRIDADLHNAAFNLVPNGMPPIRGGGFSTISLPNTFANVANKFIGVGFDSVDRTPLAIASIRSVNDFKQITTLSLTGDFQFLPVGADGEIQHADAGERVYTNKVGLAGRMFAITMVDIRNDDLGVLTRVPQRIGRGGGLYLAHQFWTEFLNPSESNFFHSNNANVNTGVANMTIGGLTATETIFMDQTDPDGKPLGVMPALLVVPTPLKAAALTLMSSERLIDGTSTAAQGDANIWRGRFRVESSPYMSNSAYTGFSAAAWYMLADPSVLPMIEIAALDGNVQPVVDTADTAFNTLGTQMRGYFAIGVRVQEYRAAVRADGGAS